VALADLITHPDPLFRGTALDEIRPEVADAYRYLAGTDMLRDQGVPEGEIPGYAEWRANRG
jgi:hypothetical protein